LSPTEGTVYVSAHVSGISATYRLHKITGTPTLPRFIFDKTLHRRPGGGWSEVDGNIGPQTCIGTPAVTCPTTPLPICASGSGIGSDVLFRNGNIWYSQAIGLPATGYTHTAVQWTRVDTTGKFIDGGRIEDPTATSSNGGE